MNTKTVSYLLDRTGLWEGASLECFGMYGRVLAASTVKLTLALAVDLRLPHWVRAGYVVLAKGDLVKSGAEIWKREKIDA